MGIVSVLPINVLLKLCLYQCDICYYTEWDRLMWIF